VDFSSFTIFIGSAKYIPFLPADSKAVTAGLCNYSVLKNSPAAVLVSLTRPGIDLPTACLTKILNSLRQIHQHIFVLCGFGLRSNSKIFPPKYGDIRLAGQDN
jgi:hypothetical protein